MLILDIGGVQLIQPICLNDQDKTLDLANITQKTNIQLHEIQDTQEYYALIARLLMGSSMKDNLILNVQNAQF